MLLANGGLLTTLAGNLTITSQDAKVLLTAHPADLDLERRAVVQATKKCVLILLQNHPGANCRTTTETAVFLLYPFLTLDPH